MGHIVIKIVFIHGESEAMGKLAEGTVAVYHMVGDGDNIKPGLTEEIDRPSQFYRAIRVFRVNVEITQ
jgi:hypothetical protein